ncbi:MAG TPA: molybdenum cofactor guanylyltransferase [Streptosporangiaceae bacterium]
MRRSAGIVLAGGRSSRMGSPKAGLEWHGSTLLRRTVGILARLGPVAVVRAAGQALPSLPAGVQVVDDPREGLGPLQGIAAGLAAVADLAEFAFVCSTDLPFLHPAFVRRILGAAETAAPPADVVLPVARGFAQPLAAGYRTALAPLAEQLVARGRLRPGYLFEQCAVLRLDEVTLAADPLLTALDPGLDSLVNVNTPADYLLARHRPAPDIVVRRSGTLTPGGSDLTMVSAATLAQAVAAVGMTLGGSVIAVLNGEQVVADAEFALASGDTVVFMAAADRARPDQA